MIKINLYPSLKRKKDRRIEKELIAYILIFILMGGGILYTNHILNSKIDKLNAIKKKKMQENMFLMTRLVILNKYKKDLKTLKQKIKTIKKIRRRQNLPVLYLNELVKHFIKNKLWINYISLRNNKSTSKMEIRGVALDNQILADYIKSLRDSPYIKEANLKRAIKRRIKGYDLISFDFTLKTKSITSNLKNTNSNKK